MIAPNRHSYVISHYYNTEVLYLTVLMINTKITCIFYKLAYKNASNILIHGLDFLITFEIDKYNITMQLIHLDLDYTIDALR